MKDFNMDDYSALKGSTLVKGLAGSEQLRFDSVESATVFFARELDQVKTKTYDKQYPELSALSYFPITSEVNEGAETTTYYSYDITGMAAIINNYATDLPRVDVQGESHTASIKSVGDSYGYNVQEMRASRMAGKSLDARKGAAARRASDYMVNKIAFAGDKKHNLVGIFSDGTDIPLYTLSEVEVDGKKYTDWAHTSGAITYKTDSGVGGQYKDMTLASGLTAPEIAKMLLLYPDEPNGDYAGDYHWFNPVGERLPVCGGYWSDGAGAGVFDLYLDDPRSSANWVIGFRSAFVDL